MSRKSTINQPSLFPFTGKNPRKWILGSGEDNEAEYHIDECRPGSGGSASGSLTYFAPGARTGETIASDRYHSWKLVVAAIRHVMKHHPELYEGLSVYTRARADIEARTELLPEHICI